MRSQENTSGLNDMKKQERKWLLLERAADSIIREAKFKLEQKK